MSQVEVDYEDLEVVSEGGATSDEWVKEGSSECTPKVASDGLSSSESPNNEQSKNFSAANNQLTNQSQPHQLSRHERWVSLLGVRNKPDQLSEWDNLYNLKNQGALRKDCRALIDRLNSTMVTVPQLESLITLYCKKRRVEYEKDSGWLDIIGKLVLLPFEPSTLFNVFYAITTKYVPRSPKSYDMFRLLLQYHDPQLCSFLDSLKIQPQEYVSDWFKSLLSKDADTSLCWAFWDHYFERGDPFLIFFVALAFARNSREQIFELKQKEEIIDTLLEAPRQMSVEDVEDLLEICFVHLNYTPISVREDFHCMLFGSNLADDYSEFPLNRLMCLPISVQEFSKRVLDSTMAASSLFTYFVIDTRAQRSFTAGSIPGSYNLNGKLIVEDPEKFAIGMNSLMSFKEQSCKTDHVCFLGSGLEEDDCFMMMVISRYLHQNVEHVSYLDGGYKALHSMLSETGHLAKLSNHFNPVECHECAAAKANKLTEASRRWSLMERMKQMGRAVQSKKEIVESKLQAHPQPIKEMRHVSSAERHGKRYRNIQSVFSINDSGGNSDEGGNDNLELSDVEATSVAQVATEKLKWAEVTKKPEMREHFEGVEVLQGGKVQVPCFVATTRTHLHIFHGIKGEPGYVRTSGRHSLSSIMRVTSKKKWPEYLTFKMGYELPTGEAHINRVHYFILPKAGDLAKAIKTAIVALKPSLLDDDD